MFVGRSDIIATARNAAFRSFGKRGAFSGFGFGSRHVLIVDENTSADMTNQIAWHAQYTFAEDLRFFAEMGAEQF